MVIKLDGKTINNLVMKYYVMSFHGVDGVSGLLEILGITLDMIDKWCKKLDYDGYKEIGSFSYKLFKIKGWDIWALSKEDAVQKYEQRLLIDWK